MKPKIDRVGFGTIMTNGNYNYSSTTKRSWGSNVSFEEIKDDDSNNVEDNDDEPLDLNTMWRKKTRKSIQFKQKETITVNEDIHISILIFISFHFFFLCISSLGTTIRIIICINNKVPLIIASLAAVFICLNLSGPR